MIMELKRRLKKIANFCFLFILAGCSYYSMAGSIPANINNVNIPLFQNDTAEFEIAENWLDQQGCTDLLPRLRNLGFVITKQSTGKVIESDSVHCGVCDAYATKK